MTDPLSPGEFQAAVRAAGSIGLLALAVGGFTLLRAGLTDRKRHGADEGLVTGTAIIASVFGALFAGGYFFGGRQLWSEPLNLEDVLTNGNLALAAILFVLIPLGSVAGRISWGGYAIFALISGAVTIPILFRVEHAGISHIFGVGAGATALGLSVAIGPRKNRFTDGGAPLFLPPRNLGLACAGTALIFAGWFGISGTAVSGFVNLLGGISGGLAALLTYRICFGAAHPAVFCQGIIGGLVATLAGAESFSSLDALIVGAVAGLLVVFFGNAVEKCRIDDVSGVVPAHLIAGIWGAISTGLFAGADWKELLLPVAIVILVAGGGAFFLGMFLKRVAGLRTPDPDLSDPTGMVQ
ncbi:MAG: ammonium transporter [Verrucomicrobiales bacterium]|nr:ammonium transporter [Verrucomicrobiales bacterium]